MEYLCVLTMERDAVRFQIILFSCLLLTAASCTYYGHMFVMNENGSPVVSEKYVVKFSAQASGYGNLGKEMEQRRFMFYLKVTVLYQDGKTQMSEFNELDRLFNMDSAFVRFEKGTDAQGLRLIRQQYNHRDLWRLQSFGKPYLRGSDSTYRGLIIPDSIETVQVSIPYYSIACNKNVHDTLRFNLSRSVSKRKSFLY